VRQLVIYPAKDWGLKIIIHVTPQSGSWPQWVDSTNKYLNSQEQLLQVDLGPGGIQLSLG
jgi:hypothetical protein